MVGECSGVGGGGGFVGTLVVGGVVGFGMRVGSLCTGFGGLDIAVGNVFGGELVFVADNDRYVSEWLDFRFGDVPNLGDVGLLDGLPDCDVLTAGFPCQPVSVAGKRKGVGDVRWLWDDIERCVGGMGRPPGLLFFENVRGLLSANNGGAMGRVVEGLAGLGYVGRYGVVSAASVGACHRRERVFIVARFADSSGGGFDSWPGLGEGAAWVGGERFGDGGGGVGRRFPTPTGRDYKGRNQRDDDSCLPGAVLKLPTPVASWHKYRLGGSSQQPNSLAAMASRGDTFGPYAAAVAGWEPIVGRPAPDPAVAYTKRKRTGVDTSGSGGQGRESASVGKRTVVRPGNGEADAEGVAAGGELLDKRLNTLFVEWMMGLPEGWVTDSGLSRHQQLKMLGNGVVPQQAEHALRLLYGV